MHLGDVFQDPPPDWSPLTVWLGKDIAGRAIGADLAKMPHLLVAGTTGAGKSACVNAMLCSILLRATPHEVRLVLVDPKQVELNHYESIPHLLTPVITSPRMAANALQNLVSEMEQRYGIMSLARTRSLPELNRAREKRGEPPLPYILCVIDELADLMMVAPADVEDSIIRLAQKARAVGIHLVLATQSPRVDVITGMIKANVPSRIAFAVSSQTDSRVILDHNGAESLLGQGDMLFSPVGTSKLQRIQGAYIDEEQIAELTEAWRRQGEPEFHEELLEEVESADGGSGFGGLTGVQPRRGPAARGGDLARGADGDRVDLDAPAPAAPRLHARRAADRHARAPRDHLRLRGIQAASGAHHRGRRAPNPRPPGRGRRARRAARRCASPTTPTKSSSPLRGQRERRKSPAVDAPSAASLRRRMADIGTTLREARIRARIDISEVEARTKIRAKYLRAIENEEWDLLPGPVYVKSFLRTYGDFLGVDSRLLVDEYKRRYERPADSDLRPITPLGRERERKRPAPPARAGWPRSCSCSPWSGRRCSWSAASIRPHRRRRPRRRSRPVPATRPPRRRRTPPPFTTITGAPPPPKPTTVTLKLVATSTLYVCVEDGNGKKLINGVTYAAGQAIPTQTAPKLMVTLGNDSVQMKVNGKSGDPHRRVADRLRADAGEDHSVAGGPAADLRMTEPSPEAPRAGILVTGTEVLSGIISDRNGPWLSERLRRDRRRRGDDPDRRRPPRRSDVVAAVHGGGGNGPDRDQRRPRADRRRPHRRGRRARSPAARWCSTTRSRSGSPRSSGR